MSTEKRVFAYPIEMIGTDKETLIKQAELLGMVWTPDGFLEAMNSDQIRGNNDFYYGTYEAEIFDSNVVVNKLELASELAHERAKDEMLSNGEITDEDGMWRLEQDPDEDASGESYIYMPEAQLVFDKWYDYYITKIEEIAQ